MPVLECDHRELFTLRSASTPFLYAAASRWFLSSNKFGADAHWKWKFSDLRLLLHSRSTLITGFQALQILKESLDAFLSARIEKEGVPGEEILAGILKSSGYSVMNYVVISALCTLCKKSSVSNVLAFHGINLVRGADKNHLPDWGNIPTS